MNPRAMSMVCGEDKAATLGADDYKEPQIICLNDQGGDVMGVSENKTGALRAEEHGHQPVICIQGNCIDRSDSAGCNGKGWTEDVSYTLNVIDRPAVYDPSVHHGYKFLLGVENSESHLRNAVHHGYKEGETVRSRYGSGNNVPMVVERTALSIGNGQTNSISMSDKANALDTMHDQQAILAYGIDRASYNQGKNAKFGMSIEEDKIGAQVAKGPGAVLPPNNSTVRRLTPLECERLQGYPDRYTDVPGASDSKRYKALGNSIALPFWSHLAHRFVEIGNVQSIGSLFDGIGGFPLVFKRAGAETKWTSEIDPFCESVVRYHCECGDL